MAGHLRGWDVGTEVDVEQTSCKDIVLLMDFLLYVLRIKDWSQRKMRPGYF